MPRPFPKLAHPIIQAPLGGGPSTPELAAAVSNAGGFGFLAGGYLTADGLAAQIERTRELTSSPFGVNLFCLTETQVDRSALDSYVQRLEPEARGRGIELGEPRFEDDMFADKLEAVTARRIPIVSFTFGCPSADVVSRLHEADSAAWVTLTDPWEVGPAVEASADGLVVQGVEAGGHRSSFLDEDGCAEVGVFALLRLVRAKTALPLIAAGGIADGAGVAAALAAGASAAAIGTAFMLCPEAGTSHPHREALRGDGPTRLTRAFTGRRGRGIVNRFLAEHSEDAPVAYPHIHHLTQPLRKAAREAGDADAINLWAGQAYQLAQDLPAGELVTRLSAEARVALDQAIAKLE
jgi:nitronate monooxygenase